jgi:hypothetical protein
MKTLLCTMILATLGTVAAKADTVTITFDQPTQTATAGGTLEFFGTITNDTASTVFLNSDSFTLNGVSFTLDDQFFNTVPVSLASGASSGDIELFDVMASDPLVDAAGFYSGSYTLVGGADGNAQDNLGTGSFTVDVANPVPEPSSICLLLSGGLAALAPLARKMRRNNV